MGLFSTSKSDVERGLKNLREYLGNEEYRTDHLKVLKSFANEKSEFRSLIIENLQSLIIEIASQNSNAVNAIVTTAFQLAGEDEATRGNIIQKIVLAYPSFISQVNNNRSILPGVIDEGIAASKSKQDNKLFFLMKTCDILAPIAAVNPQMVQAIVPKLLLAAENDVSLPQDLIPGYYDDDDATKDPSKKQNMTLRSYIVRKTVDLLPALSIQNSSVSKEIVKNMLFSTSYDPVLKNLIMRKTSHTLPALAQSNMPAAYELIQNMLTMSMTDDTAKTAILQKGIEILGVAAITDASTTRNLMQYMLTAAGAGAMKVPVLEKGCDILPTLAANDGNSAFALAQTMLAAVGDNATVRTRIVNAVCDAMPIMAPRDSASAMTLVQSLMTAVGADKALKETVIGRAVESLPSFIKADSSRAYTLLQNMLLTAAGDTKIVNNVAEKVRDMIPAMAGNNSSGVGELFARVLPATGDAALRAGILNKAFFGLTASVTDDDNARSLYTKMSGVIADDPVLVRAFVEKTTDSFVALSSKNFRSLKDGMVSNLLTTTAADPELASLFISKTLAVLPVIATKDANFTYLLVDNLLKAANGAQDTQKAILEIATAALPSVVALNADTATALNALLTKTAGEGASLKKAFTESAAKILGDIAVKNPGLTMSVFNAAVSVAGNDNDIKVPVLEKACDLLSLVAPKTDWPIFSLVSGIMDGAGIDMNRPAVYKELTVAPVNPRSNARTTILHRGDAVERSVILGEKVYAGSKFESVVRDSSDFSNYTSVKEHYKKIFNFLTNAEAEMNKSASLKEVVRDKLLTGNGNKPPKQPSAWPAS